MKQSFFMLLLLGAVFTGRNNDVTPPIPVTKEFELTVLSKADTPISRAMVNVFMSHKPDVLTMSRGTDILGKVHFLNLRPGSYIFTTIMGGAEILKTGVVADDDSALNVATMKAGNHETTMADCTVIVESGRDAAISGRKVDLLTKEDQVAYKSGLTDEKGETFFTKIPLDDYLVKVHDEMNEVAVQVEAVSVVEDVTKNTSNVEIVKLTHHSDTVITEFLVDPRGADLPKPGTMLGDGFVHKGDYEYVQLLVLKDINFDETPYCVITGMNAMNPADKTYPAALDGQIESKGQNTYTTYQVGLASGSVEKGQFFHVGGANYVIASCYDDWENPMIEKDRWWTYNSYYERGGNDNRATKGSKSISNNFNSDKKTNVPSGITVFKGVDIDKNTIPQNVVLYGGESPIRGEGRYLITDNDLYHTMNSRGEPQPYSGDGIDTWSVEQGHNDDGCYIVMDGEAVTTERLKPRVGKLYKLNVKGGPENVSVSDTEATEGITVPVDK